MDTLSYRIKALRDKKELTQKELAMIIHTTRDTVANWETGRAIPDALILQVLADYFSVSVDFLLGRTDDPTPPNNRAHQNPSSEVSAEKAEAEEITEMVMKLDKWERQTAKMIIGRLGNKDDQAATEA